MYFPSLPFFLLLYRIRDQPFQSSGGPLILPPPLPFLNEALLVTVPSLSPLCLPLSSIPCRPSLILSLFTFGVNWNFPFLYSFCASISGRSFFHFFSFLQKGGNLPPSTPEPPPNHFFLRPGLAGCFFWFSLCAFGPSDFLFVPLVFLCLCPPFLLILPDDGTIHSFLFSGCSFLTSVRAALFLSHMVFFSVRRVFFFLAVFIRVGCGVF